MKKLMKSLSSLYFSSYNYISIFIKVPKYFYINLNHYNIIINLNMIKFVANFSHLRLRHLNTVNQLYSNNFFEFANSNF